MKRFLLAVAFAFFATGAFADAIDRDVLITNDGTVYSIASESPSNAAAAGAMLSLTVQSDSKTFITVVPESIDSGFNTRPALAYDAESKTLFVMWLRFPNAMSSEILLAAYQNGKWQKAVSIDEDRSYAARYNLSVGITRRVQQPQKDGSLVDVPALILHAVWWEANREFEGARYAVLSVDKGVVSEPDLHDMSEFISDSTPAEVEASHSFLRHVAVLDGPTSDSVDVVFADQRTSAFYRTTLRPIADARVRIPVGAHPGGRLGGPRSLSAPWDGRTGTISSRDGNTIVFYNADDKKLTYVKFNSGKWAASQEITFTSTLTPEAAMAALTRMVASSE